MRKLMISCCLLVGIMMQAHCGKKESGCTAISPDVEKSQLVAFCTANNISYTLHSSGLLYQIIDSGTGVSPAAPSKVSLTYTGTLLNGTMIDSGTLTGIQLGSLIEGMQTGLPLIHKNGRIKLVIPSEMAYGCIGKGTVPPNSPLYFMITLTDVQ